MEPIRVILLPGSVLPAGPAYGGLLEALGPGVDGVVKDLELFGGDAPPPDWSLDTEADVGGRLGRVFPDFRLEVFPDRHHFDPPHRIDPERVAALLHEHWARAEGDL